MWFAWGLFGLTVILTGTGALWLLRDSFKRMGASEEREKQTYRKIEGAKKANEARDKVNKLSDSAVRDRLRKWQRK